MKKENKNEKLKLEIAELIGKVSGATLTINGESGKIIGNAATLIEIFKRVLKAL